MIKTNIIPMHSAFCMGRGIGNSQYENCISLGWFCGVASSMSRYGLRNHSGPFDWYFSDLKSVLNLMETDFYDFMAKKNLYIDANNPKIFHDKKYGFLCNHDIQNDFEAEYEGIYQKYIRRAKKFMQDIKQPTLFIRAIRSEKEISYIEENREYIYKIIKGSNSGNEIIFLLLNTMRKLPDSFLQFRMSIEQYPGQVFEMRTMFDSSEEFSQYCKKNILPTDLIEQNKRFDREKLGIDAKVSLIMNHLDVFDIASELEGLFPDIKQGIYLFGAGSYGELASLYLIKKGIAVKGIIDNNQEKYGSLCNGVPIISLSQIENGCQNVFVTVNVKKTAEIEKQILERHPNLTILTLRNVVTYLEEEKNIIF